MDLVIITVSYNTKKLLAECLESVLAGLDRSGLSAEAWVVDNASTDGSAEMVRTCFAGVRLIAHDENLPVDARALEMYFVAVPAVIDRELLGKVTGQFVRCRLGILVTHVVVCVYVYVRHGSTVHVVSLIVTPSP